MNKENLKNIFCNLKKNILNHKILTTVISVILVVVTIFSIVIFDKLDRINYNDGTNPSVVYSEATTTNTTTTTTETSPENNSKSIVFKSEKGSIVFADDSYINPTGVCVLKDGTVIFPSGTIVFKDGTYILNSGIKIDKNGTATFPDGKKLHITLFSIRKNGEIIREKDDDSIYVFNNIDENAIITSFETDEKNNADTDFEVLTTDSTSSNSEESPNQKPSKTPNSNYKDDDIDDIIDKVDNNSKEELKQNDQKIEENQNDNKIWYSNDVTNILLMGIDNGSKSYPYGRSDAMIIVSINKKTKSIKLVSLSRAAYVSIDGNSNTRLNHAHGYGGPALAIDTIEKNYKIKIDNYISTTFDAFKQLIDAVGGVDVYLTSAELKSDVICKSLIRQGYTNNLTPKTYTLDGTSALNYVRLRSIDSDKNRTQRQRNVLTSLMKKAKTMNVSELNNVLNKILPFVTTDLSKTQIIGQITNIPTYISNSPQQYVLPHKSSSLVLIDNFEVVLVDWKNEVEYVHNLFYSGANVKYIKK